MHTNFHGLPATFMKLSSLQSKIQPKLCSKKDKKIYLHANILCSFFGKEIKQYIIIFKNWPKEI